jgi:hypothetical protein
MTTSGIEPATNFLIFFKNRSTVKAVSGRATEENFLDIWVKGD